MNEEKAKIHNFTDLLAWKKGHELVLEVYRLTNSFPKAEMFGLTNQLRRASVSITSNIAEGFSRSTYADKARFYAISLGSVTEVQNQFMISRDLGFITKTDYNYISSTLVELHKIINGLIKKSKSFYS
jgi:four helix bundle protein